MSADREELVRLVAEIPDQEVLSALTEMRRHVRPISDRPWPPAWFGAAAGDGTAIGARSGELLADGFGGPRSGSHCLSTWSLAVAVEVAKYAEFGAVVNLLVELMNDQRFLVFFPVRPGDRPQWLRE